MNVSHKSNRHTPLLLRIRRCDTDANGLYGIRVESEKAVKSGRRTTREFAVFYTRWRTTGREAELGHLLAAGSPGGGLQVVQLVVRAARDKRIAAFLEARLSNADQWLDPWLSLNPSFATGGTAADLVGRRQRRTPAVIVNCGASDWSLDRPHAEDRCSPSRHRDPQRRAADSAAPGSYFRWK